MHTRHVTPTRGHLPTSADGVNWAGMAKDLTSNEGWHHDVGEGGEEGASSS